MPDFADDSGKMLSESSENLSGQGQSGDDNPQSGQHTSTAIKTAAQELLKFGLLDAAKKPNLYRTTVTHTAAINLVLEPLDLHVRLDEIRGLAFVVVAPQIFSDDEAEWSHPLVRRQRLTLEQSLVLALLRQQYIVFEQESGPDGGTPKVALEDLLPSLNLYLGETGSDTRDQKRLRNLLERLKEHGIVSEISDKDEVTIRPIIAHLADPDTLTALLDHYRELSTTKDSSSDTSS
ncbi:MAG: DUF4194 domain-containing protein [Gammaproteobacteria bacterium]